MVTTATQTMKAITQDSYGSSDVLRQEELAVPVPGDDEVLVKVHAASIHPGDWHLMAGLPYLVRIIGYGLRAPKTRVRGSDLAGRVEAAGRNVIGFQPGDAVFGTASGAFAEYAIARPGHLAIKPVNISFGEAATLPTSALTALQALRHKGQLQPGDRVLVIGAGGGVGTFAVQLAKAFGADVAAVCSTAKLDVVRSLGADEVFDYTGAEPVGIGQEHDLIIDTAGGRGIADLRAALATRGRLVIVGAEGGGRLLGMVGRSLRAALLSPFVPQRLGMLMASVEKEDLDRIGELAASGQLKPVIGRTFTLDQVPDAIRYLEEGHALGKVVVTVHGTA